MITINNLGFSYGSNMVLNQISFNMESGKIYGLLGENGVGKTTLLTLVAGLKAPDMGKIEVDGDNPIDRKPSLLERIFYLPDQVEAVRFKAIEYAKNSGRFYSNFSLANFMDLMHHFDVDVTKRMDTMSLGQLKKTYISFALSSGCTYLVMDEPTNGLDIPSKTQFRRALSRYMTDDTTVLISTHQVRDLENIIDPIIILDRQDVLLNATIEEISERLYFDYGMERIENTLYSEIIPGGAIQVKLNDEGVESKVNLEALFNTVLAHKELIKSIFKR